jgi:hypothetical protein
VNQSLAGGAGMRVPFPMRSGAGYLGRLMGQLVFLKTQGVPCDVA